MLIDKTMQSTIAFAKGAYNSHNCCVDTEFKAGPRARFCIDLTQYITTDKETYNLRSAIN